MKNHLLKELEQDGPLTHRVLCERLEIDWDELQPLIRSLRRENKVVITIDRRYDCE